MADVLTLSIVRTADGNGLPLPSYDSQYHVGLNLAAAVASAMRLESGDRVYIPVGFAIGIPDGYCGYMVSAPEMARTQGLIVLDAPRLISPADRDPLFLLLQNVSSHQVVLHRGDIVAQLVVQPVLQVCWNDLTDSEKIMGRTTQEKDELIDTLSDKSIESDKMVSGKRVYKDPRHRFEEAKDDKNA